MEARRTNAPDITDMVDDERLSLDSRHYRPLRTRKGRITAIPGRSAGTSRPLNFLPGSARSRSPLACA